MKPGGTPARITRTGSFTLPCEPLTALPLFTPEGERAWVEGWAPTYLSEANDEVGAVWTTAAHSPTIWVTATRTEDRVAYARVSDNGTAGIVDVRCVAAPGGTTVHVTYDLTATNTGGSTWLEQFFAGYDDMLEEWRNLTLRLLE
jgi:hypothetical protein